MSLQHYLESRISNLKLIYRNRIIAEVVRNDKESIIVLLDVGDHARSKAQIASIVNNKLAEVNLGWMRFHRDTVTLRILVRSPAIVRRELPFATAPPLVFVPNDAIALDGGEVFATKLESSKTVNIRDL